MDKYSELIDNGWRKAEAKDCNDSANRKSVEHPKEACKAPGHLTGLGYVTCIDRRQMSRVSAASLSLSFHRRPPRDQLEASAFDLIPIRILGSHLIGAEQSTCRCPVGGHLDRSGRRGTSMHIDAA